MGIFSSKFDENVGIKPLRLLATSRESYAYKNLRRSSEFINRPAAKWRHGLACMYNDPEKTIGNSFFPDRNDLISRPDDVRRIKRRTTLIGGIRPRIRGPGIQDRDMYKSPGRISLPNPPCLSVLSRRPGDGPWGLRIHCNTPFLYPTPRQARPYPL